MATLFDKIQQNLNAPAPVDPQAGMQGLKARSLLAAKSGKQIAPMQAASGVQEAAAVDTTNTQLDVVRQKGALAADALGAATSQQQIQEKQARADLDLQNQKNQLQNRVSTQGLLADLERDRGSISLERDRARLEQLASGLALKDRKYQDDLNREAARLKLTDDLKFETELARSAMGNSTDLLQRHLGNQSILSANDRTFNRAMGQLSIDDALAMARSGQAAARAAGTWTAVGGVANAGVEAYGKSSPAGAADTDTAQSVSNYNADAVTIGNKTNTSQRTQ